jgi:epoxide hydrolase-like predicted phosphatase
VSTYKAVVFDYGGVLTVSVAAAFAEYAADYGLQPADIGVAFRHGYPGLADMEVGRIGFREYADRFGRDVWEQRNIWIDTDRLFRIVSELLVVITPEMSALIGELRRTVKVGILTNSNHELRPYWRDRMPDDFVDAMVDSSEVGMRKPNRDVFEHTVGLLGVELAETVFFDDTPANVDGANACGMHGVFFESPAQCRAELGRLGVLG